MRKASREMPEEWALEVMRKAPYITVSFIREDGTAYGLPLSLASAGEDGRVWYFVAFGRAETVKDEAEKIHALRLICERFLPRDGRSGAV